MKKKNADELLILVKRAAKGEEEAKLELVESVSPLIKASIKRYCPVWTMYEDLYQDGIAIVLECAEFYNESRGEFLAFVNSHLKYHYLETMKYTASANGDVSVTEENKDIVDMIADDFTLEDDLLLQESVNQLKESLLTLTERQLEVVMLYYYFKLSHEDIASRLNISKWTVVNTKRAALNKLRGLYNVNK